MRVPLRERVDIGTYKNATYFNPKNLSFWEQITTSIRIAWFTRDSVVKRQERLEAAKQQAALERMENLKIVILDQIKKSMSPEINKVLKRTKKKAFAVTLSIAREYEDIIDDLLAQSEFEGYTVTRFRENHDIALACKNLPILVRFEKNLLR